jgi:hypothetical protein
MTREELIRRHAELRKQAFEALAAPLLTALQEARK